MKGLATLLLNFKSFPAETSLFFICVLGKGWRLSPRESRLAGSSYHFSKKKGMAMSQSRHPPEKEIQREAMKAY
jgi:hypothetical protein